MGKEPDMQAAQLGLPIEADFVLPPEFRPTLKFDSVGQTIRVEQDVPVIDLRPLAAHCSWTCGDGRELEVGDDEALRSLVDQVRRACEDWGFFQVTNHGVSEELLAELKRVAKAFFAQPVEEKRKLSRSFEIPLGYYDAERTKNVRDWKEVFDYAAKGSLELPDLPLENQEEPCGTTVFSNRWPEQPPGFIEVCENWAEAAVALGFKLLALIALSLGLPSHTFHGFYQDHTARAKLNHYPECPAPHLVLGLSRHKDSGALTVLVQDEVGGLQVKSKDGEWIDVKPRSDAFVINVGDCFQVWSNDRYKSVEHRVIVHADKERFSFPMFLSPGHATDIEPISGLLDAQNPPRYTKFNYGRYRKSRLNTNFTTVGSESIPLTNIQISAFAIPRTG